MNSRQKEIVQMLKQRGEITIKALAENFDVSEMTIHRDVDMLEEQRYLYKKRGAVVYIENADRDTTDFYSEEKRLIGIKAASLIGEGESIAFDNSTTALECAKFLDPSKKYVFYTTGMDANAVLASYEKSILCCCGGYYFPMSKGFVGSLAESFIASIEADVCIIGASGVSASGGITIPYPMHTAIQKLIIARSKKRILVCEHSKFDKIAMERVCELTDIDLIVTDAGISDELFEKYSKLVKIIKA